MNNPVARYPIRYRLYLIGERGTGKTSMASCFMKRTVSIDPPPTTSQEYHERILPLTNGVSAKIMLWDPPGDIREKKGSFSFCHLASAILFTYDPTAIETFIIVPRLIEAVNVQDDAKTVKYLVACKADVLETWNDRYVTEEQANELAKKYGMIFHSVNAKSQQEVDTLFENVINRIHESKHKSSPVDWEASKKEATDTESQTPTIEKKRRFFACCCKQK